MAFLFYCEKDKPSFLYHLKILVSYLFILLLFRIVIFMRTKEKIN